MSSWIVNDSVINSVIELTQEFDEFKTLKKKLNSMGFFRDNWEISGQALVNLNYKAINQRYDLKKKLNSIGFFADDWETFGQALVNMNYEAVNQRYDEKQKPSKFKLKKTDFDVNQKIKNLHCLHYQCMEGNIPETNLFKFIEELDHIIESSIISNNDLYEKAKWGTE